MSDPKKATAAALVHRALGTPSRVCHGLAPNSKLTTALGDNDVKAAAVGFSASYSDSGLVGVYIAAPAKRVDAVSGTSFIQLIVYTYTHLNYKTDWVDHFFDLIDYPKIRRHLAQCQVLCSRCNQSERDIEGGFGPGGRNWSRSRRILSRSKPSWKTFTSFGTIGPCRLSNCWRYECRTLNIFFFHLSTILTWYFLIYYYILTITCCLVISKQVLSGGKLSMAVFGNVSNVPYLDELK